MTNNFKRISTSDCLMNNNSSEQMFATGALNLASSGHMNANNFVLDKRQKRENNSFFNGENVELADMFVNMNKCQSGTNGQKAKKSTTRNEFTRFCSANAR